MPTYKNVINNDITIGSIRIPAHSSLEVNNFIEGSLPPGLSLVSDLPASWSPVILAQKYSAHSGADVPPITVGASDSKGYFISFYVESGEFLISFNVDGGPSVSVIPPAILVTEGQTWGRKYVTRVVDNIFIHCVTGGQIYVNIYKL